MSQKRRGKRARKARRISCRGWTLEEVRNGTPKRLDKTDLASERRKVYHLLIVPHLTAQYNMVSGQLLRLLIPHDVQLSRLERGRGYVLVQVISKCFR